MTEISKQYDLEDRTFKFAQDVIKFCNKLNKNTINIELIKQLIRSAGSVGANYIEANESLSKKDFIMRVKICRKEAKETRYWLNLIQSDSIDKKDLIDEVTQLMKIFGSILEKSK